MSQKLRKYCIVFDTISPSELLKSGNRPFLQDLVDKGVKFDNWDKDPYIDKVYQTEDLFTEQSIENMGAPNKEDSQATLGKLKEVYSQLEANSNAQSQIDYRFSKMDFLMFSGSNKNQLISKSLGLGVIRLFIKQDENFSEYDEAAKSDGTMLAILAVPSYFSIPDLFGFLGEDGRSKVSHFRIFRSENPSRFMVLMKMKSKELAAEFQLSNNGREFSSLEPETCQVIQVDEILFRSNRLHSTSPSILSTNNSSASIATEFSSNMLSIDEKMFELPDCPICLERMDASVTGLVTSSCLHTFHCMCLWKWKGGTCPVCRASSLQERKRLQSRRCSICSTTNNLWLCLICGNIACGRYDSAHAVHHFKLTNHCYAIDLVSQSVWDYAEDRYVHRLIRNEADGKVVELPSRDDKSKKVNNSSSAQESNSGGKNDNENELLVTLLLNIIQNSNDEYSEVKHEHVKKEARLIEEMNELKLSTAKQLEESRIKYDQEFEKFVKRAEVRLEETQKLVSKHELEKEKMENQFKSNENVITALREEIKTLTAKVSDLEKSNKKYEKKVKDLQTRDENRRKELEEEREMSKAMSQQLEEASAKKRAETVSMSTSKFIKEITSLRQELKEKEEENRDLMFYLESQEKLQLNPEFLNADISIGK